MNIFITCDGWFDNSLLNLKVEKIEFLSKLNFDEQILCTTIYSIDNERILYCLKNFKDLFQLEDVYLVCDHPDQIVWLTNDVKIINSSMYSASLSSVVTLSGSANSEVEASDSSKIANDEEFLDGEI